jgi:hypothetical protein
MVHVFTCESGIWHVKMESSRVKVELCPACRIAFSRRFLARRSPNFGVNIRSYQQQHHNNLPTTLDFAINAPWFLECCLIHQHRMTGLWTSFHYTYTY